ncbi:unnamed protein product [Linum tenue]|uniref:Uncharacterized protein n=1 Tax=Linum tenue TaxID=586396 RepID=A0AAV0N7W5_9ROSI|nr:unnamed protein product [Linum tenue]
MGWGGYGHDEHGWRKGPWTPEEDKLLSEYVKLYGDGRWSSVSKCTGLKRSGKSCRLRWVNYLRPGLKRGQLTPQEEGIIIELHALWGNKWSTIASYLPGRTDNEIKNYWRTHFKKRSKPSSPAAFPRHYDHQQQTIVINSDQSSPSAATDDNNQLQEQIQLVADPLLAVDCQKQKQQEEDKNSTCEMMMNPGNYNQWPAQQYQLVPAAFGSGPIVEDWLWSGLWNFNDAIQ